MKSRTIRYGGPGQVEIVQENVGDPGPGEVQVKGLACGICAWDIATFNTGSDPANPTPSGHEGVGVVVKVGKGVDGFHEGQRVAAGGFGEWLNVPAAEAYVIPESDLADEFWLVEPVSCIVTGMDRCGVRVGDRVAFVGCGYMGMMFLQAMAHYPVDEIIAIDIDSRKLELAHRLGAAQTYNPTDGNFARIEERLYQSGIDVVVDSTGIENGLRIATRIVRRAGEINLFGWNRGMISVDGDAWHKKGINIVNASPAGKLRNPFPPAVRLLHRGIVDHRPLISHVISLEEYPAFLARIAHDKQGYMKGVVRLGRK